MYEPMAVVQTNDYRVLLITLATAGAIMLATGNKKLASTILLAGAGYELLRYEGVVR